MEFFGVGKFDLKQLHHGSWILRYSLLIKWSMLLILGSYMLNRQGSRSIKGVLLMVVIGPCRVAMVDVGLGDTCDLFDIGVRSSQQAGPLHFSRPPWCCFEAMLPQAARLGSLLMRGVNHGY